MTSDSYKSVLKLMEGVQCAKCGQVKPRFDFERTVSKAQSKAWGYAGNVPLTIESKLCSVCQPTPKDIKQKSIKQIQAMIASGDIGSVEGERRIASIKAAIKKQRSKSASHQWANVIKGEWAELLADVRAEIVRIHQQEKNAAKVGVSREFFFEYKQVLQRLRDEFKFKAKHKQEKPHRGEDWLEYIHPEQRRALYAMWEETVIPPDYKVRMKLPAVVIAPVDKEALHRWTEADERKQEREERIATIKQRRKEAAYRDGTMPLPESVVVIKKDGTIVDPLAGLQLGVKDRRKPVNTEMLAEDLALLQTNKEKMTWTDLNDEDV
jgi:hypothetical protein